MPWNNGGSGGDSGDGPGDGVPPNPWGTPGTPPPDRKPRPANDRPANDRPNFDRPPGRPGGSQPPWGSGGRGPSSGTPPDIDELIARAQGFVRGLLPPGFGGGGNGARGGGRRGGGALSGSRGLALLALVVVAAWLASGFYRVQPDEQGVVLRFGSYERTTLPGLNYHMPWPVESVLLPAVTRINRVEVGYRSAGSDARVVAGRSRVVSEESLMLTGDENIIDIDCAVFWRVRDAGAFLFNTRNPAETVKAAAESMLREVIGRTPIQPALTDARAQIETAVDKGVQAILDQYGSGVEITQVQLQKVDPPAAVIDSFRDVQRASTDADRMRNEAESYHNDIVPRARGDAARLVAEAEGARQSSIAEATGQAQRFLSVLNAYNVAKDVTLRRLYIETMQNILTHTPSLIVDDKLKGIVPYLPLGDFSRAPGAPAPQLPAPPQTARSTAP